jgi:lysophospholipase L1-like esterase
VAQRDGGEGYLDSPTLDPDIIVLMIGVNNTWNGGPIVENVVAGNIAIIARLRQLRPRATIIIQSLLPAGSGDRDKQYIVPINRLLRQMIQGFGPKVVWLDLYPLFVSPDSSPNAKLFVDGVHPNANGYERWSPELLKTIRGINSRAPTIGSPVTARQR